MSAVSVRSVQDVLAQGAGRLMAHASAPSMEIRPQDKMLVDNLFENLSILFPIGAPVASAAGTHKIEWLKTMAVQGVVSQEQVQYGLMRARREVGDRQFWPSPLQFCRWCKPEPEDFNVPAVRDAYREAVNHYRRGARHAWSHPIVLVTIQAVGVWQFKNMSDKELFSQFSYNYEILVRRVMAGQPLDVPAPKALPDVGQSCRLADPDCDGRQRVLNLRQKLRTR
jgi:hypothetical protein